MSGIYIPGMEMPNKKNGAVLIIYPDGKCAFEDGKTYQAVPVPPHGRLIADADAIETTWMILRGLGYLKEENPQVEQTVRKVFATAPAIEVE